METGGADAVFAAVTSAGGKGYISLFAESPAVRGIMIPEDILEYISTEAIKNYLYKSCRLAPAAAGAISPNSLHHLRRYGHRARREEDRRRARLDTFCDIAAAGEANL